MPRPTIRTARATSPASQSLETKPRRARGARRRGRDAPGARDEQHARGRGRRAQPRAHLRAGLRAQEEVDERDVRRVAPGVLDGLVARARRQEALHPRLLAQHQPEAPVDDVVVVDDEDPQLAVVVSSRHRQPHAPAVRRPAGRSRRARRPPAPRRRPGAGPCRPAARRGSSDTPSLTTSSTNAPSRSRRRTSMPVGVACLSGVADGLAQDGPGDGRELVLARPRPRQREVEPRCAPRRRVTSSRRSVAVARLRSRAGSSAVRSSASAAWISSPAALAVRGLEVSLPRKRERDAEQPLDDASCRSRARSMRSLRRRASSCSWVACRAAAASPAIFPSDHRVWRWALVSGPSSATRSATMTPIAATTGGHRDADRSAPVEQVVELGGQLALHVPDLDDGVLAQRVARRARPAPAWARAGEQAQVDAVRADRADQPALAVVGEDHRAAHVGEQAGGVGEPGVEGVRGPGLRVRQQLGEEVDRLDRHHRRRWWCRAAWRSDHSYTPVNESDAKRDRSRSRTPAQAPGGWAAGLAPRWPRSFGPTSRLEGNLRFFCCGARGLFTMIPLLP